MNGCVEMTHVLSMKDLATLPVIHVLLGYVRPRLRERTLELLRPFHPVFGKRAELTSETAELADVIRAASTVPKRNVSGRR